MVVRAHQCVEDGYEFFHKKSLVTLFSAPNYCNTFDNAGAAMLVKEDLTCSFSIVKVATQNYIQYILDFTLYINTQRMIVYYFVYSFQPLFKGRTRKIGKFFKGD